MTVQDAPYAFTDVGELRRVSQAPSEVELAGALRNKSLLSAVARHMPGITHELALVYSGQQFDQSHLNIGWWLISALRCQTLVEMLVPVAANASWDTLPAVQANSCDILLLEDVPSARRLSGKKEVSRESLDWVQTNLDSWIELLEKPPFRLAVDSMTTHHQHANLRMSAAALWAGFESLFGISSELRFRLAILAAAFLEVGGEERLALYRKIKKLYDFRSKAVHGGATSEQLLTEHIIEVRSLLSRLICKITETGRLPSIEEYEEYLLG